MSELSGWMSVFCLTRQASLWDNAGVTKQTASHGEERMVFMKLNVKPVYVHLVHRSAYMGPCRGGTWEQLERS